MATPIPALFAAAVCLGPAAGAAAAAGTFYVDASNPGCTGSGPGTEAQPYCSISAAVGARGGPGTTIIVKPGVYREQVNVRASGTAGSPLVLRASGPGVIVDGADDLGEPVQWGPSAGTVWLAAAVTWAPNQVIVDGARLTPSTASPSLLPANTFTWVSGEGLYVNLGGDSPGLHQTLVGRRTHGINMVGRSWITIEGFTVVRAESRGIYMQSGCTNVSVLRNDVSYSSGSGIQAVGGSDILIEANVVSESGPHGIGLTAGATNCTIRYNEVSRSVDPAIRRADGIYLYGAPANTLYGNRLHHNQDSGVHFGPGSNGCVAFNNLSWNNGDHGYDHLGATGTTHMHDVAYGNTKDGFSIEGAAVGTQLHNCIAVENGLTTGEYDLWVDDDSNTGFVSDYNIFWNSAGQEPINFMRTEYQTVAEYRAVSGQDIHSIQADPRFVNPGAGDFHLLSGSPAIDSGDSGLLGWPVRDAADQPRVDVPAIANTGAGPVNHADRGALEHQLLAPVARLEITPSSGTAPLTVTADASASSDVDGAVVAYRFDFGDGTSLGPQASPTATHTFNAGLRTVTVTVTDDDGLVDTEVQPLTVATSLQPALSVAPATGNEPLAVVADASASTDSYRTIVSYQFTFGDGTVVGPRSLPTCSHTYGPGTWTATVTVQNDFGETESISRQVIVADVGPEPNLVGNPSLELDSAGWEPVNATLTRVAGGFDAVYALRAQGPASTTAFGIADDPDWIGSTPARDTRYRFRAWVRSATAGGRAAIRIREFAPSGQPLFPGVQSTAVQLSPTWRLVTLEYPSQAAGSTIDFQILDYPAAAGEVFEIDNISIQIALRTPDFHESLAGAGFVPPTVSPNPLRELGSIRFALSQPGRLRLQIFDVTGRVIRTLAEEANVPAGAYAYTLDRRTDDGRTVGPGVYFYRVEAQELTAFGRFLIIR